MPSLYAGSTEPTCLCKRVFGNSGLFQVCFNGFCSVESATRCTSCVRAGLQSLRFELSPLPENFLPLGLFFPLPKPPLCCYVELNGAFGAMSRWEPERAVPRTSFFFWPGCTISFLIFLGIVPSNPSDTANTVDANAIVLWKGKAWRGVKLVQGQLRQCWWCVRRGDAGCCPAEGAPLQKAEGRWGLEGGFGVRKLRLERG